METVKEIVKGVFHILFKLILTIPEALLFALICSSFIDIEVSFLTWMGIYIGADMIGANYKSHE